MFKSRKNTTKAPKGNATDPAIIAIKAANKLRDVFPTTDASADAWGKASLAAIRTVPTTNAGALALIKFALLDEEGRHHGSDALCTIARFLNRENPDDALIALGPQIAAAVSAAIVAHGKFKEPPEADTAARDIAYKHWTQSARPIHELCSRIFQHKPQTAEGFAIMALAAAAVNYDGLSGIIDCPEACALVVSLCDYAGLDLPQSCAGSLRSTAGLAAAPSLDN